MLYLHYYSIVCVCVCTQFIICTRGLHFLAESFGAVIADSVISDVAEMVVKCVFEISILSASTNAHISRHLAALFIPYPIPQLILGYSTYYYL